MPTIGTRWTAERRAQQTARIEPIRDRVLARIEPDTNGGCWLWTGAFVRSTGYGTITSGGRSIGAHRASYEAFVGPIPKGSFVCHKCDVRACVNPAHLFVGSQSENVQDMLLKGRGRPRAGSAHSSAILVESDIPIIRSLIRDGRGNREIGERFGVSPDVINAIRAGRSWRSVTEERAAA